MERRTGWFRREGSLPSFPCDAFLFHALGSILSFPLSHREENEGFRMIGRTRKEDGVGERKTEGVDRNLSVLSLSFPAHPNPILGGWEQAGPSPFAGWMTRLRWEGTKPTCDVAPPGPVARTEPDRRRRKGVGNRAGAPSERPVSLVDGQLFLYGFQLSHTQVEGEGRRKKKREPPRFPSRAQNVGRDSIERFDSISYDRGKVLPSFVPKGCRIGNVHTVGDWTTNSLHRTTTRPIGGGRDWTRSQIDNGTCYAEVPFLCLAQHPWCLELSSG